MYSFVLTFTHSNPISSGALLFVLSLVHSNIFLFSAAPFHRPGFALDKNNGIVSIFSLCLVFLSGSGLHSRSRERAEK